MSSKLAGTLIIVGVNLATATFRPYQVVIQLCTPLALFILLLLLQPLLLTGEIAPQVTPSTLLIIAIIEAYDFLSLTMSIAILLSLSQLKLSSFFSCFHEIFQAALDWTASSAYPWALASNNNDGTYHGSHFSPTTFMSEILLFI